MRPIDLARIAGIAPNTARALAGRQVARLDFSVLARIAAALNMRPMELLEEYEIEEDRKAPALALA
jgi:DNA-binding Xre family transcriptional regulator